MRALAAALLSLVACAEPVLVFPEVDGVKEWLVVASGDGLPIARVLAPTDSLQLTIDDVSRLEALAFTTPLGLGAGAFPRIIDGDPLPDPARVYSADLDALSWASDVPSAVARELRLPLPPEDCSQLDLVRVPLETSDHEGVRSIVSVEGGELTVYTSSAWYHVTQEQVRSLSVHFPAIEAATLDPFGTVRAVAAGQLWSIYGDDPFATTATTSGQIASPSYVLGLASPRPGEVFALTRAGELFRSTETSVVKVHQFTVVGIEIRGAIGADGLGVLAGFGSDSTFVRVEGERVTPVRLPVEEGVTAIARHADLGIVVGTTLGVLRAERDEFRELADPLGKLPRGVPLTSVVSIDDRLYFGGRRVLGEVTPRGFVCQFEDVPPVVVKHITRLGSQLVVAGYPLDRMPVELYRYVD